MASSHPKNPSPPAKTVILHEEPSSDIDSPTPDTPFVTACSPRKETKPTVQKHQEHQEPTELDLSQPPAAAMATSLSKIRATATSILTATPITDNSMREEISKSQNQQQPFRKNIWNGRMDRFSKPRSTTFLPEEVVPTTQGNAPDRTGLLAAMGTNVSRAPLTKIKDPAVMRNLMVLAKERRASQTLCNVVAEDGISAVQHGSGNQFKDRSRTMMTRHEHRNDNDNDTLTTTTIFTTTYNSKNNNNNNNNNNYTISNSLSASASSRKITLEDKRAFLKTQETLRRSNQRRSRSFHAFDLSTSHSYPFPASPSPAAEAHDSPTIDFHSGFPWRDRSQGHAATPPISAISIDPPHHPFLPLFNLYFFNIVDIYRFFLQFFDLFVAVVGVFEDIAIIVP
ncbi:hypothetical protein BGZ96_004197 [Linnemannia gamsii]|uniref:Uncharacterized protein n=1 Tax=Linnemannia gamsii TaxID=64522 RepID=A0ABQ7KJL7_9FUNG|nr:hypothetical protein BGZ96_004197 [Linnemannia gamsii]